MTTRPDPGPVDRLLEIMARLRDPRDGCPWDREQSFATIAPYTIEEAYEVAEAIRTGDVAELREELGDLLFQVVYHAQMARELGHFAFADVVAALCDKMVRRHPHVFATGDVASADAQTQAWEAIKAAERAAKDAKKGAENDPETGVAGSLDGVPLALPALTRAEKLQKRAARVGFDWRAAEPIYAKIAEEAEETRQAVAGGNPGHIAEELGDLLFACANLARHLRVDPEAALRAANAKFERRFRAMEVMLRAEGRRPEDVGLSELDALWDKAKAQEGAPHPPPHKGTTP